MTEQQAPAKPPVLTEQHAKNMTLWERVRTPDPKRLKSFNRGGFRGTAINATYLAQLATREFGPMGIGWGAEIVTERYVEGHLLADGVTKCQVHVLQVRLWYVHPEARERATVEQFGQTTFVGQNSNGIFTDEEAPKKSYTDALSKCLSLLGFAADVFEGRFDDNKYVARIEAEEAADRHKTAPIPEEELKLLEEKLPKIAELADTKKLDLCDLKVSTLLSHPAAQKKLRDAIATRRRQLQPDPMLS